MITRVVKPRQAPAVTARGPAHPSLYTISNEEAQRELRKLIDWFRSPEGDTLGRNGDIDNLSPADCAIRAMRELRKLRRKFR